MQWNSEITRCFFRQEDETLIFLTYAIAKIHSHAVAKLIGHVVLEIVAESADDLSEDAIDEKLSYVTKTSGRVRHDEVSQKDKTTGVPLFSMIPCSHVFLKKRSKV